MPAACQPQVGQVPYEEWQAQHVADYVSVMDAWHRALQLHCASAAGQEHQEEGAGGLMEQQQWLPIPISLYSRISEEYKARLRWVRRSAGQP